MNLKQPILKSREMEENDSKQKVIKYKFSYKRKRNVKTKQQFPSFRVLSVTKNALNIDTKINNLIVTL